MFSLCRLLQSAYTATVHTIMFQYVFSANVMVKVATRPAENPVGIVAKKLSLGGVGGSMARHAPHLSLPGKLVFPSSHSTVIPTSHWPMSQNTEL